jgi:hypothetical protein
MAKRHFLSRRLKFKSPLYFLITRLCTHYSLSPAESELLSKEILDEIAHGDSETLADGQMWYTAIHQDEPAGKPLSQCRKVRVKLTTHAAEDIELLDLRAKKSILLHRLAWEALRQQGLLTVEDMAHLLHTSEKTIRRLVAQYRKQGIFIPLRGYYKDIGPGTSHKAQAIRLFLKGYPPSKIATILGHHIQSIERYLDDFCIVMMALEEGYGVPRICRHTKLSERLVKEYQAIYVEYTANSEYEPVLNRLRERLAYLMKKKTGELVEEAL